MTSDPVNFPAGKILVRLANEYPFVLLVILENVQNALDANARNVSVRINQKTSCITVRDDGDGVSVSGFQEALQSVCESAKSRGKLGQFGIGLISPLGKCERFTFTSSPRDKDEFREWTFNTAEIEASKDMPNIPRRSRSDLHQASL